MMNEGKLSVISYKLDVIAHKLQEIEEIIASTSREIWSEDNHNFKKQLDMANQLGYVLECVEDATNRVELIEWKMEKEQA